MHLSNIARLSLSLSLILVHPLCWATGVSGRVTLANGKPAKNAVVWLEGGVKAKPMSSAMIDQRDMIFSPHVSVVTVGTKVDFPNHDTVFHNVFAEFDAKRFDLGMYARGQTRSITFDKPGLVAVLCSVHSDMSAYIMVVDTPYCVVTDAKGQFKFANVPAGKYTVHVWHEAKQAYDKDATVGATDPAWVIKTTRQAGRR